jgi:ribosomal protection tetracycline resistance protein
VRLEIDPRAVPLYVYGTAERFRGLMARYVRETLREGLHGWEVTDCVVTVTACDYYVGDGRAKPTAATPRTSAADFRKLTPLVLMRALDRAGSVVCEPALQVRLEVPTGSLGAVLAALARLGGAAPSPSLRGELATIEAVLSAPRARDLQRRLPALTGGEGVLETEFTGYEPVTGPPPTRRRTTANPLNREEYFMHLARRVGGR